jgi:O-succinylbenzoic acid--CoA ligase
VAPSYGLTEAASQVATRPPEALPPSDPAVRGEIDLSAGLVPLPGTEIRIVGAEGRAAAVGAVGEIEVRGPTLMWGYLDDAEATARVLRGGWLATGDLGRLDAEGRLRILDRRSDLIVSGGENVYPAEIEAMLTRHPAVAEVGVVGIPDDVYGARPCAFVVAAPGQVVDTVALREFSRGRLAGYKLPIRWIVLEALPRTASGKLLRRDLKARAEALGQSEAARRPQDA